MIVLSGQQTSAESVNILAVIYQQGDVQTTAFGLPGMTFSPTSKKLEFVHIGAYAETIPNFLAHPSRFIAVPHLANGNPE